MNEGFSGHFSGKRVGAVVTVWLLALGAMGFVGHTPLGDALCQRVAGPAGFDCASDQPLADSQLRPGDILDDDRARVGTLDAAFCRIPGVAPLPLHVSSSAVPATRDGAQMPYSALGALLVSGRLRMPLPRDPSSDASRPMLAPGVDKDWNELRSVDVHVHALHRAGIDPDVALHALESCSIRTRCLSDLRAGRTHIVTATLVADDTEYRLRSAAQTPLDTLVLKLSPSTVHISGPGTVRAIQPIVIGTQSLARAQVDALKPCEQPVGFEASGTSIAAIAGHGDRGAFPAQSSTQPLGTIAQVFAQGKEHSDCDTDRGVEASRGYAQADLQQTHSGGLQFAGEVRATSGRYLFGRCSAGRRLPTNNTLTNNAMARVHIEGTLDILVRHESDVDIDLRWHDMPAGTTLRVVAPDGSVLSALRQIDQSGTKHLRAHGPGVFHVQPTVDVRLDRTGESGVKSSSFKAAIDATVQPVGAAAAG